MFIDKILDQVSVRIHEFATRLLPHQSSDGFRQFKGFATAEAMEPQLEQLLVEIVGRI